MKFCICLLDKRYCSVGDKSRLLLKDITFSKANCTRRLRHSMRNKFQVYHDEEKNVDFQLLLPEQAEKQEEG